MKKNNIFWVIVLILFINSCQQRHGDMAVIEGNLSDAAGTKLTLQEMDTHEIRPIDSIVLGQSGKFDFRPVTPEPGFWLLKSETGKVLVMMLDAGDKVTLTGSAHSFPDQVFLEGPRETKLLNDFFRYTRQNELMVDLLEMLIAEHQDSSDYYQYTQKLDTIFKTIWENQRSYEMAFIDSYPGSLASLIVLNYAFGMSPVLSPEEDFGYYKKLDSALFRKFPENKHVKFHHQRVVEQNRKSSVTK
jgi:hypothetical protein